MQPDDHDYEDKNMSLTRAQIRILRGRTVADLSALEKMQFADAAPRPIPANKLIPEEYRFRISIRQLEGVDPMIKLEVANGADRMGRIRQRMAQIQAELATTSDPTRRQAFEYERNRLSEEGRVLFARIGKYEERGDPAS